MGTEQERELTFEERLAELETAGRALAVQLFCILPLVQGLCQVRVRPQAVPVGVLSEALMGFLSAPVVVGRAEQDANSSIVRGRMAAYEVVIQCQVV